VIRAEYGIYKDAEIGTNAAHDAIGVVNLYGKYMFYSTGDFSFSANLGLKWFNPKNFWILSAEKRDELSAVNVYMIPVALTGSYVAADWIGLHLRLGYTFSTVDGALSEGDALAEGGVGGHEVFLQPALTMYPLEGVAVILGAQLPVYSGVYVNTYAETEVYPGVVAGGKVKEFQKLDVKEMNTLYLAVQLCWGSLNLRLTATKGLRFFNEHIKTVLPGAEVFWRF